jgi:hypothetical protein
MSCRWSWDGEKNGCAGFGRSSEHCPSHDTSRRQGSEEQKGEAGSDGATQLHDPESRIMKGHDTFVQSYNSQIAVEPILRLICGRAVTQQANDKQQ